MSYEKVCSICGTDFTVTQPNGKYCSDECKRAGKNIKHKEWYDRTYSLSREDIQCRNCGETFAPRNGNHKAFCTESCRIYWLNNCHEGQIKSRLEYSYKKKYGISIEDYDRMSDEQNHVCAICGQPQNRANTSRLSVDHNHETGSVRGLLCHLCNSGLGAFQDDPQILTSAIEYLNKHKEN